MNNEEVVITKKWCMPNKNTFTIKPIEEIIKRTMKYGGGVWIDPFANESKLAHITNDLNSEFETNYHLDALEFLKLFDSNSVDGVLFDPPYSPRQISESYKNVGMKCTFETTQSKFWSQLKKEISRIVKPNGYVISCGWNSNGIGKNLGFKQIEILLVAHGGAHNDTIVVVEKKN